jgi:hypothetical protein
MDLSPGQRRLVFVVVVIVLIGLGFYLVKVRGSGSSSTPSASASTPAPSATTSAAPGVPPSSVPAATPVSTVGGAEIYQWLPFTATDLAAAASTVTTFATDYVTWSYAESTAAYVGKLQSLVTSPELTQVEQGYETPGVAGPRAADKQVSTGSGTIEQILSFGTSTGPKEIVFTVAINQQVTSTQPTQTQGNQQYDITVQSSGGPWQVSDVELAGLGNQGNQ